MPGLGPREVEPVGAFCGVELKGGGHGFPNPGGRADLPYLFQASMASAGPRTRSAPRRSRPVRSCLRGLAALFVRDTAARPTSRAVYGVARVLQRTLLPGPAPPRPPAEPGREPRSARAASSWCVTPEGRAGSGRRRRRSGLADPEAMRPRHRRGNALRPTFSTNPHPPPGVSRGSTDKGGRSVLCRRFPRRSGPESGACRPGGAWCPGSRGRSTHRFSGPSALPRPLPPTPGCDKRP